MKDRIALVIGNADYTHVGKLNNPKNDAKDIEAVLNKLNFDVTKVTDASVNIYAVEPQVHVAESGNQNKTYREFVEKWLPFHARKKDFHLIHLIATGQIWTITSCPTLETEL